MDLSALETFCTLATEQSVTRVASLPACVPTNVTGRMRLLKQEIQMQLFSRERKCMMLTQSGHHLFGYAQRTLALADEARESMRGPLRIGTLESAAARLPSLLARYHSRWPDVDLEIRIGTSKSLTEDVAAGCLDCAFVAEPDAHRFSPGGEAVAGQFDATYAYTEDMLLVLPSRHPSVRSPQELRLSTLAVFAQGCTYRSVLERWLSGAEAPDVIGQRNWEVIELNSYHAILACVMAGTCFALCPQSVLARQRPAVDLRTRHIASVGTWLIARTGYSGSAYEELRRAVSAQRGFASGGASEWESVDARQRF